MNTPREKSRDRLVVVDGAGDRYEVVDYAATFTLIPEAGGKPVRIGSAELRSLGLEWNGQCIKELGSL